MENQQGNVNWLADIDNIKNMDLSADSTPKFQSPCATSPMMSDSFSLDLNFNTTPPRPEGQPRVHKLPRCSYVKSVAYDPNSFKNTMKNPVRRRLYFHGTKKSNAKIRLWSDGSDTFHEGAESFDVVHQRNIQPFTRHGCCYQPQGFFVEKMTFRPKVDSENKMSEDARHKAGRNADRLARQKFSQLRLDERKTSSNVKMHLQTADEDGPEMMEDDDDDTDDDVEELSDMSCSEHNYSSDENVEMEDLMFKMDSDSD